MGNSVRARLLGNGTERVLDSEGVGREPDGFALKDVDSVEDEGVCEDGGCVRSFQGQPVTGEGFVAE